MGKRAEKILLRSLADADAAVPDAEAHDDMVIGFGRFLCLHDHFALLSKLDCVADQICKHLAQTSGVAAKRSRNILLN